MADTNIKTRIKLRTDTYTNWTTTNPVLLAGEVAVVEKDGKKLFKVGDGTTAFNSLAWASEPTYDSEEEMLVF